MDINKQSQKSIILKKLKEVETRGYTSYEAFEDYRFTRLAAIIFDLRRDGYVINMSWETSPNEKRYGLYIIDKVQSMIKRTLRGKKY